MFGLIDQFQAQGPYYLLVFIRISAMVITMPIFGFATISVKVRVMIAFSMTLMIAPALTHIHLPFLNSWLTLLVAILREVLIGLIIGFGARLIFEAFTIAGAFVSMQMGIAMMNVLDPSSEIQLPLISQFWMMLIVIFFLVTNSHHFLVETIYQNFSVIQLGEGRFKPLLGQSIVNEGAFVFEMALRLAAPAVVLLLLVDVCLAFIAKVMPQMNIFFVSLPLKLGVGMVVLILSLKMFQVVLGFVLERLESFVLELVAGI